MRASGRTEAARARRRDSFRKIATDASGESGRGSLGFRLIGFPRFIPSIMRAAVIVKSCGIAAVSFRKESYPRVISDLPGESLILK